MSKKLNENFIISNKFKNNLSFLINFDNLTKDYLIDNPKNKNLIFHHFFKLYQIDSSFNPKKEYFEIGKKTIKLYQYKY